MKNVVAMGMLLMGFAQGARAGKINMVTTTSDAASIARFIVGDAANVTSLTTGLEDPHTLTAKPSFIVRAREAEVWIRIGMELEIGWEPVILRESRNSQIRVGSPRHLDLSEHLLKLGVPEGTVTRDRGDIHPEGNPHVWLDPLNGRLMAAEIAERLGSLYPECQTTFNQRLRAFNQALDTRMFGAGLVQRFGGDALWKAEVAGRLDALLRAKGAACDATSWRARLAGFRGETIVTYHDSWRYFLNRFGLRADLQLEPKPGIPPTASHLASLADVMRARRVRLVLQEPFYPRRAADWVAGRTGAKVVIHALMTGGSPEASDYLALLESLVTALEQNP